MEPDPIIEQINLSYQDIQELNNLVDQKYIHKTEHPTLPLSIYNYTPKTQFEGKWTSVARMCRGLVLDDHYDIVIRCIPKFFNQNEPLAAKVDLTKARILEKLDGYLIQVKVDSDWGLIVTSRGSFDNKYTEAARRFITDEIIYKMIPNYTYFCELLQNFPGDETIILTKHPEPRLVCWAVKDEDFNEVILDETECPFPMAKELSLAEAKEYLKQKVEGIVAQDLVTKERVKLKTDWFIENHRLISDCSKKRVWEILSNGQTINTLDVPDEFMPQMLKWASELNQEFETYYQKILKIYSDTEHLTDKELGLLKEYPEYKPFVFLLRKDRYQECLNNIWQQIKPKVV